MSIRLERDGLTQMSIRRYIKAIAIVLIILPEPFTTPIGIALLTASIASSRPKRLARFGNLDELILRSYKIAERRQFGHYSSEDQNTVFHALKRNPAPSRVLKSNDSTSVKRIQPKNLKKLPADPVKTCDIHPRGKIGLKEHTLSDYSANRWFDNRKIPEKVFHHTLKTSFPQYEPKQPARPFSVSTFPAKNK
jgi:hypothetical protein